MLRTRALLSCWPPWLRRAEHLCCAGVQTALAAGEPGPAPTGSYGFSSPHRSGPSSLATLPGDPGPPPGLLALARPLPNSLWEVKLVMLFLAEEPLKASLALRGQVQTPWRGPWSPATHAHRLPRRPTIRRVLAFAAAEASLLQPQMLRLSISASIPPDLPGGIQAW